MPCFGVTGRAPDMETYDGRGWEPERTYHTPRLDQRGTSKSAAVPAAQAAAATRPRSTTQRGIGTHGVSEHERHVPAHVGFHPNRSPYGAQAGWDKGYSTRREPPEGPSPARDSGWPVMMGGKVLAGGRPTPTPEHRTREAFLSYTP